LSNFLRRALGLSPLAISFLRECFGRDFADGGAPNAKQIKHATIKLTTPQSMMRAISTAGGIARDELDENLMLRKIPGLFAAGEMLDWEAPTGGYLLQACFATGVAGARGMLAWLKAPPR
jgi:predicted flavoprotein YhiN